MRAFEEGGLFNASLIRDRTLSGGEPYTHPTERAAHVEVTMSMGPNVKALMIRKMSRDAVLVGGGIADAVEYLTSPAHVAESAAKAYRWAIQACQQVRDIIGSGLEESDDEEIAGHLVKKINAAVDRSPPRMDFGTTDEPDVQWDV